MTTDKTALLWACDILHTAKVKLAVVRDNSSHAHAVEVASIMSLVDAAGLICKQAGGIKIEL